MKRCAFASSVMLLLALGAASVFAQAKPAQAPAAKATTPAAQQAPAAPAKFVKTLKGTADIQFIADAAEEGWQRHRHRPEDQELSNVAVSLLKVDEDWYNRASPPQVVTGDSEPYRKPFMPGEVIELTMRSPWKADLGPASISSRTLAGRSN